jgi:ABC-type multidrug transport system fused ATPase/permease subunit
MDVFYRLIKYVRPYWVRVSVGIACTLVIVGLEAVQPLLMRHVIDNVLTPYFNGGQYIGGSFSDLRRSGDLATLELLGFGLFGVYLARTVFSFLNRYLLSRTGQDILLSLRVEVYDHMQHLSLRFYNDRSTGELMSRVTGDVESLQNTVTDTLESVLVNVTTILIFGSILFGLSWTLALIVLAPLPIYSVLIMGYNRRIRPYYTMARERIADISALLQDNITGIRVIQCFARENHELGRFVEKCKAFWTVSVRIIKIRVAFFPFARLIISLGPLLILYYGGIQVMSGFLTIGTLFAFQSYLWRFYGPVESLTRINDTIVRAAASARRVFEILDTQPDIQDAADAHVLDRIQGRVEFQDVSFAYDNGPPVLNKIHLTAEPGQLIGLVGPSGAGKTTVINLICRFYDPDSGAIRVDGHAITGVQIASLRSQIGMVLQEPFLFNGTVRENIAYGKLSATEEDVIAAAAMANAHDFICGFTDAYDTRIGERGVRLSGGEKQRISIARAILNDPRILILDEATSSVDSETELLIQNALERLMAGRTTFAIAHRLSTVRRADCLYVIDHGEVLESGTHSALLKQNGLYARLCDMQFALEETE